MTTAILTTLLLSAAPAMSEEALGNYVRTTRDIQTAVVYEYPGVSIVNNTDESVFLEPQDLTWNYDKYCQGSPGNPTPYAWTTPVASTFDVDLSTPIGWGNVYLPGHHAYERRVVVNQFAQYDVVVIDGVPQIENYVSPAVEHWQYELTPGGAVDPDLALTRTVHSFSTSYPENHIWYVGGGGGS